MVFFYTKEGFDRAKLTSLSQELSLSEYQKELTTPLLVNQGQAETFDWTAAVLMEFRFSHGKAHGRTVDYPQLLLSFRVQLRLVGNSKFPSSEAFFAEI